MEQIAAHLRGIASALRLPSVRQLALEPTVREVFRVTVQYSGGRFSPVVTTVLRRVEAFEVQMVYGLLRGVLLTRVLLSTDYETLASTTRALGFDNLPDDVSALDVSADLWFVERAAASFSKSLLINTSQPKGPYAQLVDCFARLVPEVARQIPLS